MILGTLDLFLGSKACKLGKKTESFSRQAFDRKFDDQYPKRSQREFNSAWVLHKNSYVLIFTIGSKRLDKKLVELWKRVACLLEPTLTRRRNCNVVLNLVPTERVAVPGPSKERQSVYLGG